ncbi:MAG TPA: gliding motility-associated C-terminal domain-containing protein [Bacteroidia bacterium]|nr:gliding motility-associated C-terminal domain-containing protein [Bacteroidia bacterium]
MAMLLISGSLYAQPDPPDLRCVSVSSTGSVTLNWIAPADTGNDFNSYHIYYSNVAAGPYIDIDSIFNYNTLTTTLTSVNASTQVLYFYIKTREGCCSFFSTPSDTLRSMRMIVTPLSNQAVRLNWNRIHTPPLASTAPLYDLEKELTPGVYSTFYNGSDTTTNDTNIFCSKFINYRVTQGDASGCESVSSIDGELFSDTQGPAATLLDTVSVDPLTGNATISWLADTVYDTMGYIIYQFNGSSYDSIGIVFGINSTFFNFLLSQADNQIESFAVAPFDSCKNLGSLTPVHRTILLDDSFEKCSATVSLQWNSYSNMSGGVNRYEIWFRVNGGTWTMDGIVPPTTLSYQKVVTVQGGNYEFYVRAIGASGKSSSSNIISRIADIYDQPDHLYIRSASVVNGSVTITCDVDPGGDIVSYRLYHSQQPATGFSVMDEIPYTATPNLTFYDLESDPAAAPQYYKISAKDSCGAELTFSNVAKTVYLEAEGGNDFISTLTWDDYSGWPGPTGSYNIYRLVNGVRPPIPFASVGAGIFTLQQDVSSISLDAGDNYCYVVEALEGALNMYGFMDNAFSNEACAPQEPLAFIPNAFTPGGKNPVFKPVTLFALPGSYTLRVFNRWGQEVFKSDSPETGWDGQFEGSAAPQGIYIYQMVFKGYNLKEVRKTGTVLLMH